MPIPQIVAKLPLFGDLLPAELAELTAAMQRRAYAKGDYIFYDEDPATACHIIETGRVKIGVTSADGKQVTFSMLGPGDLFGELALLDDAPRSADAIAMEPCQILELRRETFLTFLDRHPAATAKLLVSVARRLRRTSELLEDAVFLHVPARLAKVLFDLAESQGRRTATGIMVDLSLNQSELASLVGATRESINKWLGYYQQRGLLSLDGGQVLVRRPRELRQQFV